MIALQADNRSLTAAAKFTYTTTNYASGVTSFYVLNATDNVFAVSALLLLGNFGAEDAEIVKILTVNNNTGLVEIVTSTLFAHSESTRVTVIPYDQIRFFHTTISTFDIGTAVPLTGYTNLQPSDWFTTYNDPNFSTGFGWYCFYNSVTNTLSQESNAIPYTGFADDTTENILSDFFSMLSNKELRLVTREDALSWAREGYGRMRNKLNLTNVEFTSSPVQTLSVIPGVVEYDLPGDFDHLISLVTGLNQASFGSWGGNKKDVDYIPLREAYSFNGIGPRYYIRGFKIGILPTPQIAATYNYIYQQKVNRLNLNTDVVALPNGGEFVIKDYMLYRAYQKFQNPQFNVYLKSYTDGLNDMVISAVKRDANLDSFGIQRQSNV